MNELTRFGHESIKSVINPYYYLPIIVIISMNYIGVINRNISNELINLLTLLFIYISISIAYTTSLYKITTSKKTRDLENNIEEYIWYLKKYDRVEEFYQYIKQEIDDNNVLTKIRYAIQPIYYITTLSYHKKEIRSFNNHSIHGNNLSQLLKIGLIAFIVVIGSNIFQNAFENLNVPIYIKVASLVITLIVGVFYGYKIGSEIYSYNKMFPLVTIRLYFYEFLKHQSISFKKINQKEKDNLLD